MRERIKEIFYQYSVACFGGEDETINEIIQAFVEALPEEKDSINASFSNRNLKYSDGWMSCLTEIKSRLGVKG